MHLIDDKADILALSHVVIKKSDESTVYVHLKSHNTFLIGSRPPIAHGFVGCFDTVHPGPIDKSAKGENTETPNHGNRECDPIPTDDTAEGAARATYCVLVKIAGEDGSLTLFHRSHNTGNSVFANSSDPA